MEIHSEIAKILYTNYKGETKTRTIKPIGIWFGSTDFHPQEQWILSALDCEKKCLRHFAMKDIKSWGKVEAPTDTPSLEGLSH